MVEGFGFEDGEEPEELKRRELAKHRDYLRLLRERRDKEDSNGQRT